MELRQYVPYTSESAATTCMGHITEQWMPKSWEHVCGKQFVYGWPSDDTNYVDYRPTLLVKGETSCEKSNNDITRRNERVFKQTEMRYYREVSEVLCTINVLC